MCNAFTQRFSSQKLAKEMNLSLPNFTLLEPAEVYPNYQARIILVDGMDPLLTNAHWSLVPKWSSIYTERTKQGPKYSTNNARSETITTSKLFAPPWNAGQRCVFPVSTFNEWRGEKGSKEKLDISASGSEVTFLAGIFERDDHNQLSCTMLTIDANEFMKPIHDRMPVILDHWEAWLDPEITPDEAQSFLKPYSGILQI